MPCAGRQYWCSPRRDSIPAPGDARNEQLAHGSTAFAEFPARHRQGPGRFPAPA